MVSSSASLTNNGWRKGVRDFRNGHVLDNAEKVRTGATFRQPRVLLENVAARFQDVSSMRGNALEVPQVSRGLVWADHDYDGDLDVLVSKCGGSPQLLRNEGPTEIPGCN